MFFTTVLLCLYPLYSAGAKVTDAEARQSIESINQAAASYLSKRAHDHWMTQTSDGHRSLEISVESANTRLKLPSCTVPLIVEEQRATDWQGRVNLKVHCKPHRNWVVNINAKVQVFENVLILDKAIAKNTAVTGDNITRRKVELTRLQRGYYTDLKQVLGLLSKRHLRAGTILAPTQLTRPLAIRRGENVQIIARNTLMTIRTEGKAMADGRIGDVIRVKNQSTKRLLDARIQSPGVVEIRL